LWETEFEDDDEMDDEYSRPRIAHKRESEDGDDNNDGNYSKHILLFGKH